MATFIENKVDEHGNPKKILLEQDEIELGILKQLFYKVNYKKIPQSRYRKLHKINWIRIWCNLILAFIVFGLMGFTFFPDTFQAVIEKVEIAGQHFGLKESTSKGIFVAFSLVILSSTAKIYSSILARFKINEVKLPTETIVKNSEATPETVFNKNMDEIVYFFEETGYHIVFFEDLDRLENSSIFIHLRELNTILNNYDVIKKPIVFVYAIKDDIFTDTDRTKFFDFIIPVIPIINSTNSGEIFLQKLEESKRKGINHEISQGFILDVAPYVEDMRILQNIYNEFIVYKKTIRTEQELKLSDETMMALIIFKNLYPRDFADLQMERGIVKQSFIEKQNYISSQCLRWQNEIAEFVKKLEKYYEDSMREVKELKTAMLGSIVNWKGIAYSIQLDYWNSCSVDKIMEDSFDLSILEKIKETTVHYYSWGGHDRTITINDFGKIIKIYFERIKSLQLVQEKGENSIKKEIQDLRNKAHVISGWSIKKLMEEFDIQEVLSDKVRENKVLIFMLRRGYIDEKYTNYINYFKGTSITRDDMNFILAVKNMERLPYNYNLTKVDMVIQRLQIYEFEQKEVYNFILLEYLLSKNQNDEKLRILIIQLSDETEESWNFINEFIDRTRYKGKFIRSLALTWDNIWNYIVTNVTLTYERKIFYLLLLINEVTVEQLVKLNGEGKINDFIENNIDILQRLSTIQPSKVISLIEKLGIIFKNILIENVSEEVLEYIFENQYYELNNTMIHKIVEFKDNTMVPRLDVQNYTIITTLGYEPLIELIWENLEDYIERIVLAPNNVRENIEQIMDLLERCISNPEICLRIIKHEEFCLNKITECCKNIGSENIGKVKILWDELLANNKVRICWENIEYYWIRYGIKQELLQYIESNGEELEHLDSKCISERFIKDFIMSTVKVSTFEMLLPKLKLEDFDIPFESISESKIEVMINQKYFPFEVNRYIELKKLYPDLCSNFILHNQNEFRLVIASIPMEESLLEELLDSPLLESSNVQILLDTFGVDYMSTSIAKSLYSFNATISIPLFDAAWGYLEEQEKKDLMFSCLAILGASEFEKCFLDLPRWYSKFCDRTKRHGAELENTDKNKKLAERLKEVSYITSYVVQEKEIYDSATETKKKKSVLFCWIKAVKA